MNGPSYLWIPVLLAQLLLIPALAAENLPRRTHLGLQFDLTDRSGPGLLVEQVLPQSTAQRAGMRPGDRLTSVGRVDVLEAFQELRAELARTPAGARIPLRWYRGSNRVFRVSPPLTTLPLESMPGSLVRYETVVVDDIGQRLILSEPVGGSRGLVFLLSGLACESLDFWYETDDPIKQLLDGWAAAGYATARLEKRGVGDSAGPDCAEFSFEDERRGYAEALAGLAGRGYRGRMVLFGHGLGGVIAPLIATDSVAGVMVYGTVSEPWNDHMIKRREREDQLAARTPGAQTIPDMMHAEAEHSDGRSDAFFVELGRVDPERAWRQVWQPVLALHGEYDWVSSRGDHERIARLTSGRFESLPGLDHELLRYDSLLESFRARGTGRPTSAIVDATLAWMATLSLPGTADSDG